MISTPLSTSVGDRYFILERLGQGGFSETFLAADQQSSPPALCVVKELKCSSRILSSEAAQLLFETEVQTLLELGRANDQIPSLLNYFVDEGRFYLVQEFVAGNSLMEELSNGKRFNQVEVVQLLQEILPVLKFIHDRNVIHCDIKPRNIIRRQQDDRLVLIDFGAVRFSRSSDLASQLEQTAEAMVIGTPGYMPNEQQAGRSRFSSDIYALGMVVIHCLTGIHPRKLEEDPKTGEIIWQHHVNLHPRLLQILEKMVKVRVRVRYQSADEVLQDLEKFESLATRTIEIAVNPSVQSKPISRQSRQPVGAIYGGVAALLLLGGLGWSQGHHRNVAELLENRENLVAVVQKSVPHTSAQLFYFLSASIPIMTAVILMRLKLW
jgi:serine/threonine protein kinase